MGSTPTLGTIPNLANWSFNEFQEADQSSKKMFAPTAGASGQ